MSASSQLERTHFVVVGAGGLGCPALLGLTAAGARQITIVDPDRVEASNLHRQVLYTLADVGRTKAEAAAWSLRQRLPALELDPQIRGVSPEGAEAFLAEFGPQTVLLECTDAPALKFALNDAGLRLGLPVVIGASLGVRGQCIAVRAGQTCYRCIYEAPPPEDELPTCASAGVLGVAVGLAGFLMANTAIALCQQDAAPETAGGLLAFDVTAGGVQTLRPKPRPGCPACAAAGPSRFPFLEASA